MVGVVCLNGVGERRFLFLFFFPCRASWPQPLASGWRWGQQEKRLEAKPLGLEHWP